MGGSRGGGQGVPTPPPPWNCQIINFCHVENFSQTPSGNLDPPPTPHVKLFHQELMFNVSLSVSMSGLGAVG